MIRGFRTFVLRGNVIDLAVAFVVGASFAALIATFTEAVITPVVNIFLGGGVDVGTIVVRDQTIDLSGALNAFITFFITLTVLYFIFVVPMNRYRARTGQGAVDATPAEIKLLTEIRDLLKAQERQ
jgi:large conductance mechanosensitive channel